MSRPSLLYQISSSTHSERSFLFGTVHIKDQRVIDLADQLNDHLNTCMVFAPEMSLSEFDISIFEQSTQLESDFYYKSIQSKNKFTYFCSWLQKQGLEPLDFWLQKKPMIIQQQILSKILISDAHLSQDEYIATMANEKGMQIHGLESFVQQMQIFRNIPNQTQWKSLKKMIQNIASIRHKYQRIINLYLEQESFKLYRMTRKDLGQQRTLMIQTRNALMSSRMIELMNEHSVFAAVGAAHLHGKFGMIRLLKSAGFQVKAISI